MCECSSFAQKNTAFYRRVSVKSDELARTIDGERSQVRVKQQFQLPEDYTTAFFGVKKHPPAVDNCLF